MAIYHFDASVISRSKGRSATAATAYRAAERIEDHRTGEVHDYTRKSGVLHSEIIAPTHAPDWAQDRSALWNAVEQSEQRKDAQVAREVRVALPSELTLEQNRDLVCAFVQDQFVGRGMIADIALHAPGREGDQRNHHAHIMLTTREIGPEGFGAKNRDWNAKDLLLDWREAWAEHVNATLDRHSIHERVDHRTLVAQREDALSRANEAEERGDDRARADHMAQAMELDRPALPQIGASAWSMMRRGLVTPAAEQWREAREIGIQVRDLALEFRSAAVEWLDRLVERLQAQPAVAGLAGVPSGSRPSLEAMKAAMRDAMALTRQVVDGMAPAVSPKEVRDPSSSYATQDMPRDHLAMIESAKAAKIEDVEHQRPAVTDLSGHGVAEHIIDPNEAVLREIEKGVAALAELTVWDWDNHKLFEPIVTIRSHNAPDYLELAEQLLELAEERSSGALDDRDIEKLDVLIKETVTSYGDGISRTIAAHLSNHERIQAGQGLEQLSVINEMEMNSLREFQERYDKLAKVYEVEIRAGEPYTLDEEYFEYINDRGYER